jgi:sugar O-acyltransferase (sialic acid O-acetyltransferase NeuD family)
MTKGRTKIDASSLRSERNCIMGHKSLVIIGTGGHAKVCLDIAELMGQWDEIVFFTEDQEVKEFMGYKVVDGLDVEPDNIEREYFVAIGDSEKRKKWQESLVQKGASVCTLIHPSAIISRSVTIGMGTVVMAGTVINPGTRIGDGCIINTSCSIDHDNIIGKFSHLSPGACTAGGVNIGENVWVGVGVNIINNVKICSECTIGAGALIIVDIEEPGTYVGVPAVKIK